MSTYARIEQLRGKENKRMMDVLRYIAEREGYISEGNIQYRKMYFKGLRDRFIQTARCYGLTAKDISNKQYKRLRKYGRGMFSIHICIYLKTLYEIMLEYHQKAEIGPQIDGLTYTEFMLNYLRQQIFFIVNNPQNPNTINQAIFVAIYNDIINLDNNCCIKQNQYEIYNNIW